MNRLRSFVASHLDPADRIGEALFGLIMALGFTGAVRLGIEEAASRELFVAILGCNLAWGIVDGVMYVMLALFERNRQRSLLRAVAAAPSDEVALAAIAARLDERVGELLPPAERPPFYRAILAGARRSDWAPAGVTRTDLLGGVAAGLMVVLATLPMLVPFLLVRDPMTAVRLAEGVALALLFGLGVTWARMTGGRPLRVGLGLVAVGAALVAITIVLGG